MYLISCLYYSHYVQDTSLVVLVFMSGYYTLACVHRKGVFSKMIMQRSAAAGIYTLSNNERSYTIRITPIVMCVT